MKTRSNKWLLTGISAAVFYTYFLTLNIVRSGIVCAAALLSLLLIYQNRNRSRQFLKKYVLLELSIIILSATYFYDYWINANRVKIFASKLSMQSGTLLLLLALLCAAAAFYGLNILITCVVNHQITEKIHGLLKQRPLILNGLLLFGILLLQLFQFQRSSLSDRAFLFQIDFKYYFANLLPLLTIYLLLFLIIRKEKSAALVSCILVSLFSVTNYYVIQFHGAPLFPSEFANTKAAINVLSGYSFVLGPQVFDIIAVLMAELCFIKQMHTSVGWKTYKTVLLLAGAAAAAFVLLFSPFSLRERYPFSWKFDIAYDGFVHCSAANLKKYVHPIRKPNGYKSEAISIPDVDNRSASEQKPDIVVIVNETFCDLSIFSDIQADQDYMDGFYHINNARYGFAFSTMIGSGTNNSEFEVLTSDSMYLLNSSAPFNYINFNEKNSTFLEYLKSLGYDTYAMHAMSPANYSRGVAYPALGFNHVFLGDNRACDINYYGNRQVLDKDEYKGIISLLEEKTEHPRFFYLLTYQNHGGYEQNDASFDLIHTTGNYGDLTDDVNEYLTSVSFSASAIHDLIDYLRNSDHPVMLCMVGDHPPVFLNQIEGKQGMTPDEAQLWQHAVPYVIWANFEYKTEEISEYASMTDLIPMMLASTNMPMTPFYQQVLNVHKKIPVRTSFGICVDSNGDIKHFDDNDYLDEDLTQYFFMEYNELLGGEDYKSELFQIP
ncbi:MAG: LTA synthase family protein [Ruminococcaceae bacterium]|nr:LTA synthase family protein [Oscillospiraceae bacterium]